MNHDGSMVGGSERHISLIRDHIHYRDNIFETAANAVSEMGIFNYTAVHLRRNDFQYAQAGMALGLGRRVLMVLL